MVDGMFFGYGLRCVCATVVAHYMPICVWVRRQDTTYYILLLLHIAD